MCLCFPMNTPPYNHPFKDYPDLSSLLLQKGMLGEAADIEQHLKDVGYQRLSAYWKPFMSGGNIQASIEDVWHTYCFDRKLRLCILDAIERIEVAVRSKLVHVFCKKYDECGYAYLHPENFDLKKWSKWLAWCTKIEKETRRNNSELVREFRSKYSNQLLPMWTACELMSFGATVTLFEIVEKKIQQEVSHDLQVKSPEVLLSWLKLLNDVRNACAHQNRVWNRTWQRQPMLPRNITSWHCAFNNTTSEWELPSLLPPASPSFSTNQTGIVLTICRQLLKQVASASNWKQRLFNVFDEPRFSIVPTGKMGLPPHWREHPLWQ